MTDCLSEDRYSATIGADRLADTVRKAESTAVSLRANNCEPDSWKLRAWTPANQSAVFTGWMLRTYRADDYEDGSGAYRHTVSELIVGLLDASGGLYRGVLERRRYTPDLPAATARGWDFAVWDEGMLTSHSRVESAEHVVAMERGYRGHDPVAPGGFCDSISADLDQLPHRCAQRARPAAVRRPEAAPKRKRSWSTWF
ncbi:hypothetical protein [Nocardia sp. NPDC057455]|uniref:hypothetical protein n=1 Tax=Nocardia sp. NPDC057455 TaxID=3346138 RepID=UPI003671AEEA